MVEGWKKKNDYVGSVYIPAKGCDLKNFIIINLQRKMLLICDLINIYVSIYQNHCIKLFSLNLI